MPRTGFARPRVIEPAGRKALRLVLALALLLPGAFSSFVALGLAVSGLNDLRTGYLGVDQLGAALFLGAFAAGTLWVVVRLFVYSSKRVYESRMAAGRCGVCNYNLRGLHEGRCPECGYKWSDRDTVPAGVEESRAKEEQRKQDSASERGDAGLATTSVKSRLLVHCYLPTMVSSLVLLAATAIDPGWMFAFVIMTLGVMPFVPLLLAVGLFLRLKWSVDSEDEWRQAVGGSQWAVWYWLLVGLTLMAYGCGFVYLVLPGFYEAMSV